MSVDEDMLCCSAPGPEALLEALLERKLTVQMVVDAGKGQAQKWINDKLTPKESLLASMGAEDHAFMVMPFFNLVAVSTMDSLLMGQQFLLHTSLLVLA